jgi:hypothetical protein
VTVRRESLAKAAPTLFLTATLLIVGCVRRPAAPPSESPSPVQEVVPSSRVASPTPMQASPMTMLQEAPEPYVDLEMVDAPVKLVLQKLAELGKLELIIPPNLNKTISVQYVHVPVSVALKDVLARSGLRLGTGPAANLPFDTVTVFYHLPANVDSMSADAIMRRFGVSRAMAELIVKSRRP